MSRAIQDRRQHEEIEREPPRLTQREIDARESGWETRSNSTNAIMARVIGGPA